MIARVIAGALHVLRDAGIACEVAVDIGLCGGALDAQLRRQAERGHAVDQSEVDDLRVAPLFARHQVAIG